MHTCNLTLQYTNFEYICDDGRGLIGVIVAILVGRVVELAVCLAITRETKRARMASLRRVVRVLRVVEPVAILVAGLFSCVVAVRVPCRECRE